MTIWLPWKCYIDSIIKTIQKPKEIEVWTLHPSFNITNTFHQLWLKSVLFRKHYQMSLSYSALMDIPGLEDTQMVDGSKTRRRSRLVYEYTRIASENKATLQGGDISDTIILSKHSENRCDNLLMLYIQSLHGTCWSSFCCRQEVPSGNLPANNQKNVIVNLFLHLQPKERKTITSIR